MTKNDQIQSVIHRLHVTESYLSYIEENIFKADTHVSLHYAQSEVTSSIQELVKLKETLNQTSGEPHDDVI